MNGCTPAYWRSMWRIVLSHVAVAIAAWCATIHTTENAGNAPTPPNTTESSSDARHVFSWATASEQPCADRMQKPIAVSDLEVKQGRLDSLTLHAAFSTFAACGVVVLTASNGSGLVPAGDVGVFRDALEERLKPSLSSRSRVRDALKMAMLRHTKLGTLWEETLQHESLFDASDTTRERSDGRSTSSCHGSQGSRLAPMAFSTTASRTASPSACSVGLPRQRRRCCTSCIPSTESCH